MESFIEQNKESYYLALRRTQGSLNTEKPDFTTWLTFFLRVLQKQKIHLEQKIAKREPLICNYQSWKALSSIWLKSTGRDLQSALLLD